MLRCATLCVAMMSCALPQRPYDWGEEEAAALLDDLLECLPVDGANIQ